MSTRPEKGRAAEELDDVEALRAQLDRIEEQLALVARGRVLGVSQAVSRLPIRDSKARAWLRREGLISDLAGREVVVWDDVVERLRRPPPAPRPRRRPSGGSLPRVSLD